MIRFKCVYCGQRILAPYDGAGKKSKCPKCEHILVVPKTTKGRPAISTESTESIATKTRPPVSQWSKSVYNPKEPSVETSDEAVEVYKESFGFLIPTYDELSLFLMAVVWILMILVFASKNQLLERIPFFLDAVNSLSAFIYLSVLALMILAVLALCIYHVFTTREKTYFEKKIMLVFAVLTNILVGIIAGIYVIRNTTINNWQIVFPIWNIINVILLYLMIGIKVIDVDCISDRDATGAQIILGLAAVFIIFIFCNYLFKLHWAITFSICIVYTTSFDRAIQHVLPGLIHREDEQAA